MAENCKESVIGVVQGLARHCRVPCSPQRHRVLEIVKAAVGGHFWKASHLFPRGNGCGRSIACYGGQMYITEIPDEIFVEKMRNEIIKVSVGSEKR